MLAQPSKLLNRYASIAHDSDTPFDLTAANISCTSSRACRHFVDCGSLHMPKSWAENRDLGGWLNLAQKESSVAEFCLTTPATCRQLPFT